MPSTGAWDKLEGKDLTQPGSGGGNKEYQERSYRNRVPDYGLVSFQVTVKETDLYLKASRDLREEARASVLRYRWELERYIGQHPEFLCSLVPLPPDEFAPPMVQEMLRASRLAGVGPMAAVAGAMAERVGRDLLSQSAEIIVENGGDIFFRLSHETRIGIFAGNSPLSYRVGIRLEPSPQGQGVCTSSGTVGPSLSFGRADAVCVLSPSAALADAAATTVGNLIRSPSDLQSGLEKAKSLEGLTGVVIVIGKKLGAWGDLELIEM